MCHVAPEYSPYLVVNAGLVTAIVYGGYYAILDPIAGVRFVEHYKPRNDGSLHFSNSDIQLVRRPQPHLESWACGYLETFSNRPTRNMS